MGLTVENIPCPECKKVVTVVPTRAFGTSEAWTPTGGPCPNCGTELNWDVGAVYLKSFKPEGAKEGSVPFVEVKIVPKEE